jgi:hypothetical protein
MIYLSESIEITQFFTFFQNDQKMAQNDHPPHSKGFSDLKMIGGWPDI